MSVIPPSLCPIQICVHNITGMQLLVQDWCVLISMLPPLIGTHFSHTLSFTSFHTVSRTSEGESVVWPGKIDMPWGGRNRVLRSGREMHNVGSVKWNPAIKSRQIEKESWKYEILRRHNTGRDRGSTLVYVCVSVYICQAWCSFMHQ